MRHLLREIDDTEWNVPSLSPDWDVQGVVAHLTGIETVLSGWRPSTDPPGLFDQLVPFMEEARGWSPHELLDQFEAVTAARRAELGEMEPHDFEAPCWTPVGHQTYGRFMAVRVFAPLGSASVVGGRVILAGDLELATRLATGLRFTF